MAHRYERSDPPKAQVYVDIAEAIDQHAESVKGGGGHNILRLRIDESDAEFVEALKAPRRQRTQRQVDLIHTPVTVRYCPLLTVPVRYFGRSTSSTRSSRRSP